MKLEDILDQEDTFDESVLDRKPPVRVTAGERYYGWITEVQLMAAQETNDFNGKYLGESCAVKVTLLPSHLTKGSEAPREYYTINHVFWRVFTEGHTGKPLPFTQMNKAGKQYSNFSFLVQWLYNGGVLKTDNARQVYHESVEEETGFSFPKFRESLLGKPLGFSTIENDSGYINCGEFFPWVEGERITIEETPF